MEWRSAPQSPSAEPSSRSSPFLEMRRPGRSMAESASRSRGTAPLRCRGIRLAEGVITTRGITTEGGRSRYRARRISRAARSPVVTPPSMKPWKSWEVCSPAKWMFPSATPSIPLKVVY